MFFWLLLLCFRFLLGALCWHFVNFRDMCKIELHEAHYVGPLLYVVEWLNALDG